MCTFFFTSTEARWLIRNIILNYFNSELSIMIAPRAVKEENGCGRLGQDGGEEVGVGGRRDNGGIGS